MTKRRSDLRGLRAARAGALARIELRSGSAPRSTAAGPVSMAIKTVDPQTRAAIDQFLKERRNAPNEEA